MIVKITIPAGPNARFTQASADSMIGQDFNAKREDAIVGRGKVLATELIDSGSAIVATIEWPEEVFEIFRK